MLNRSLTFSFIMSAGLAAAQNAIPAPVFGPQTVSLHGGSSPVNLNFGLQPLVHGPYSIVVLNLNAPGATISLNGTQIFGPNDFRTLEISKPVSLQTSNTLAVNLPGIGSTLFVTVVGWQYVFAHDYDSIPLFTGASIATGDVDWRNKGAVTPVKNQGACQDSWAFSTTGAIEGLTAIKSGHLTSLAEQELLDCSAPPSCLLGSTARSENWVIRKPGLTSEANYPYTARTGTCKASSVTSVTGTEITGIQRAAIGNEDAMKALVDQQPVSVVINGNWFNTLNYRGGIADPDCESQVPVFASALVTGYETFNGTPVWIVKNSLGTSWGSQGYFFLPRGQNKCGIADYAIVPTK